MSANTAAVEFSLPDKYHTDRRSPVRWIISHAVRQWLGLLVMLIGAIGNALLAAVVPVLLGQAFNAILKTPPQLDILVRSAILIAITQTARSVLQLGRNFGAELVAQRMERDIRDELYTSLLGKSMTFHSLQPVGDTMARATNDVREVNFLFSPGLNLVIGSLAFLIMPIFLAPRYHTALMLVPSAVFIVFYLPGALAVPARPAPRSPKTCATPLAR